MATVPVAGLHIWQPHDSWWGVSRRYTGSGLNWVHIAEANPQIRNTNQVAPGTRVRIPGWLLA